MLILVMGVTGSGKTTVGKLLAQRLKYNFLDADDFHSAANREKMHQGIPLTDADRAPWLTALHDELVRANSAGRSAVLACSALKQEYRNTLAA
jgi:gluconokinase